MLIVGDPSRAFALSAIPNAGVGLARTEFIVTNHIGIHPMALARYPQLEDPRGREGDRGANRRRGRRASSSSGRFSEGVARIAAAFYPKPVIVRTSDFKTNEYARLLGGREFEPAEENPMIGFRGASRYYDPRYAEGFALECAALLRARRDLGLTNIKVMIPFCRTVDEGRRVHRGAWRRNGLRQGEDGLEVYAMCEVPSNAVLAEEFLRSLRRLLDRFERSDAADARARSRFGHRGAPVRRAQRRRALADRARDRRRAPARQADRHLRPGAVGLSRASPPGWSGRASTRSR